MILKELFFQDIETFIFDYNRLTSVDKPVIITAFHRYFERALLDGLDRETGATAITMFVVGCHIPFALLPKELKIWYSKNSMFVLS